MKSSKALALAVSLALATAIQPASIAGTVTSSMPVSLTVTGVCTRVSASPLNFGSNAQADQAQATAQASISVDCSEGTVYSIDLDNGLNPDPNGSVRTARHQTNPFMSVAYKLYTSAAETVEWGTGQAAIFGGVAVSATMGQGGNANHSVYGRIFFGNAIPGTYTDTVTVTVTY